jgi:hypothetical protein
LRNIRFRVYDTDSNIMIYDIQNNFELLEKYKNHENLMQFTTLYDRTVWNERPIEYNGISEELWGGVPIWEGDIMLWGKTILEVKWEGNMFFLDSTEFQHRQAPYFQYSKVIGNKFEQHKLNIPQQNKTFDDEGYKFNVDEFNEQLQSCDIYI